MPNYSTPRSVPDKFGKFGGRTAYPAGKPTGQGADLRLAALNEPRIYLRICRFLFCTLSEDIPMKKVIARIHVFAQ